MCKREPVTLNVYDLHWSNQYLHSLGVGIFHSGVEVYGIEYAYGGHRFALSGIFDIQPRDHADLGDPFRYRQSIRVGYTDYSPDEISDIIGDLGEEFRGDRYHLINNNCNHFADSLAEKLCGRGIPGWVNRLAQFGACLPFLTRYLPRDWLTPVALEHNISRPRKSSESLRR